MSLIIKLQGVRFNNPNLPTLHGSSLVDGNQVDTERGAIGHWLLGGGRYCFTDLTAHQNNLSAFLDEPQILPSSVQVSKSTSLDTGITFGQGSEITMCCVFYNDGSNVMPLGTMMSSGDKNAGITLFTDGNPVSAYVNGYPANNMAQIALSDLQMGHVFLAASIGNDSITLYSPHVSGEDHVTINKAGANAYAPRNMSIGPMHYGDGFGTAEIVETILFDKALSLDELRGIYANSKHRLSRRGINI